MRSDGDWRGDCRQLLELMLQRPDSLPFREPVDTIEFPDYLEIISTPMDLRTVKEDLLGGNYEDPLDFAKDVRLIFQNSKNYNTNKRSRVSWLLVQIQSDTPQLLYFKLLNYFGAGGYIDRQFI